MAENGGTRTELHHTSRLQVSVPKLQMNMLEKYSSGFYITYDVKIIDRNSGSAIKLLLPPQ